MKIEEKVENFRSLLKSFFLAQKNEIVKINKEILEKNDFNIEELKKIICPTLLNQGFLKSYHFMTLEVEEVYNDDFRYGLIYNDPAVMANPDLARPKYVPLYSFIVDGKKLEKIGVKKFIPPVFDLPPNTKWEDITIRFKDSDSVEILRKGRHSVFSDYKKMRFGKNKPDRQWELLKRLSGIYAAHKQLEKGTDIPAKIDDLAYSLLGKTNKKAEDNVQTIKKLLSQQLQEDFEIYDDEPFEDYEEWGYYKTKFQLIPEPELRRSDIHIADKRYKDYENHEDFGEGSLLEDDSYKIEELES